jgi:subtilase family serine protease
VSLAVTRIKDAARRRAGVTLLCAVAGVVALTSAGAGEGRPILAAVGALRPPAIAVVPLVQFGTGRAGEALLGRGAPFTPEQIRANYSMGYLYAKGLTGKGRTIGIVDAYGSPTITADLASFDEHYGVPAPPSFKVIQPAGAVPPYSASATDRADWAFETTLDVEWAHAMAPGASIVLAETPVDEVEGTSGFAQIVTAEKALIEHYHVAVISQSFGATEETFPSSKSLLSLRSAYVLAARHGVTVLAASGDDGVSGGTNNRSYDYGRRVVGWPASDPLVTAVGGTAIYINSAGKQTSPVQVWNESFEGGGGGVSEVFGRPAWQDSVAATVGSKRGIPDVALLAACSPGVGIYESFDGPAGITSICGTSLATPLFAGIVAIAAELHNGALGLINPDLYKLGAENAKGLVDVTHGDNTVTVPVGPDSEKTVNGYSAVKGYDLASGLGTVNAWYLAQELAGKTLS